MPLSLQTLIDTIRAELQEWQDYADRACTALTSTPFVVATEDGCLAIRVVVPVPGTVVELTPVKVTPGCCGVSHLSRKDAEYVASKREDYYVVAAADIPRRRIASLTETLAILARLPAESEVRT